MCRTLLKFLEKKNISARSRHATSPRWLLQQPSQYSLFNFSCPAHRQLQQTFRDRSFVHQVHSVPLCLRTSSLDQFTSPDLGVRPSSCTSSCILALQTVTAGSLACLRVHIHLPVRPVDKIDDRYLQCLLGWVSLFARSHAFAHCF